MKNLTTWIVAGMVLASAAAVSANDGPLFKRVSNNGPALFGSAAYFGQPAIPPAPAAEGEFAHPHPMPVPGDVHPGGPIPGEPVELYPNVKYVDLHEMAPCAVPMIVQVPNPHAKHHRHAHSCCAPPVPECLFVKICVPACGCCTEPIVRPRGKRTRYDFGKYAVDIRVKRNGLVVVDYQN